MKVDKILEKYNFVSEEKDMSKYQCSCGWVYDPKAHGGKPFSEWPGPCPKCGKPKSAFHKM